MSDPTASDEALPLDDPKIGLMVSAAEHLIPLFKTGAIDTPLARKMAMSAIAAYNPDTRADYINVARTIAFSMAALALLGRAASEDMTFPEQMRAYGRANALNRSAAQSERAMMQRRRYDKANPPAELPGWMDPGPETPAADAPIGDAEIQAAVAEAIREYRAHSTPARTEAAVPEPTPEPAFPAAETAAAPATAIRYSGPRSDISQSRMTYRETLLRNSAMQQVAGESGGRHSGAASG